MSYKLKNEIIRRFESEAQKFLLITDIVPDIVIVAGSGIAQSIPSEIIRNRISYNDFNCFPAVSVAGHKGEMLLLKLFNKNVLIFSGRFHLYEGRSIEEICSQSIFTKMIGSKNLVLTNAAGGLSYKFKPGDLMLIKDVLSFQKANIFSIFDSKVSIYQDKFISPFSEEFIIRIQNEMTKTGIPFYEGTYLAVSGPNYETRAEIRMMRRIQADAVGMSTFFELLCGYYLGLKVAACSLITNAAKEIPQKVSHEEVTDAAFKSRHRIWGFIEAAVRAAL
jgi:purine-nucleoside phosphorylase